MGFNGQALALFATLSSTVVPELFIDSTFSGPKYLRTEPCYSVHCEHVHFGATWGVHGHAVLLYGEYPRFLSTRVQFNIGVGPLSLNSSNNSSRKKIAIGN